jgi:hypothetical protein
LAVGTESDLKKLKLIDDCLLAFFVAFLDNATQCKYVIQLDGGFIFEDNDLADRRVDEVEA